MVNRELQILLRNLDSILDEVKHVLISTKPIASQKKEAPFFLAKVDNPDMELLLVKINKYKKLKETTLDSSNDELKVDSIKDIFSDTENLIKKISEGACVSDYTDKGFFKKIFDISQKIKRLLA
jgi:hypothetical protein